jgi:hypothetical protein
MRRVGVLLKLLVLLMLLELRMLLLMLLQLLWMLLLMLKMLLGVHVGLMQVLLVHVWKLTLHYWGRPVHAHLHVELVHHLLAVLLDFGPAVLKPVLPIRLVCCFKCGCGCEATHVDLVKGHVELVSKLLLGSRGRLVLGEKVLLEDVMLVFGEARLDIADGRLWCGRSAGRAVGVIAGGCVGAHLSVGRIHPRRAEEVSSEATSDEGSGVEGEVQMARREGAGRGWKMEAARLQWRGERGEGEGESEGWAAGAGAGHGCGEARRVQRAGGTGSG